MKIKYYKHTIENLINIEKIVTIHYFEFNKDFSSSTESHDFYELIYACRNDFYVVINNVEILLKQGNMMLIKPNIEHYVKANNIDDPNIFIISFSTKSQTINYFNDRIISIDKKQERYIYQIIEESKETFDIPISNPNNKKMELKKDAPIGGLQIIKNYLELLLIKIIRNESTKVSNDTVFLIKENFKEDLSGKVITILNNNIDKNITIEMLENELHYNKSYIFKQFKKQTGKTIIEYFTLLKIAKAKQLLENSSYSIKQISEMLSFDSPSYFGRIFKKYVNLTPLQYKNGKE